MPTETAIQELRPEEAAERVFRARRQDSAWLARFSESLAGYCEGLTGDSARQTAATGSREKAAADARTGPGARRSGSDLLRTIGAWQLSQAKAARLFGVSRQAFAKWLQRGVPADHAVAAADLRAATDLLERHLKRDRIPAVVRRPIPKLDGLSLLELGQRDTSLLLSACREMFDFERAHR